MRAELEEVEQLLDALREDGLAQQMVAAEDTQVVDRRDRVDEHVLLERDADARPDRAGLTGDVEPEDADRPRGRPGDAVDHAEGRGLAGPVRPEETEAPTPRDVEIEPVDGEAVAEALRDTAELDEHPTRLVHLPVRSQAAARTSSRPRIEHEMVSASSESEPPDGRRLNSPPDGAASSVSRVLVP